MNSFFQEQNFLNQHPKEERLENFNNFIQTHFSHVFSTFFVIFFPPEEMEGAQKNEIEVTKIREDVWLPLEALGSKIWKRNATSMPRSLITSSKAHRNDREAGQKDMIWLILIVFFPNT